MSATTTARTRRIIGTVCVGLIGFALFYGGGVSPANAVELPTWDDVQTAKQNEADAGTKVKEIEGLIEQSKAELELLRVATEQANARWRDTETAAAEAALRSETLQTKATKSREEADAAANQAGALVGQMYRSGGIDRSADMFFESDADTTDLLLNRLAMMEQASRRNTTLAENAENALNTATSLGEQAEAASKERDQLNTEAERLAQTAAENLDAQRTEFLEQEATAARARGAARRPKRRDHRHRSWLRRAPAGRGGGAS